MRPKLGAPKCETKRSRATDETLSYPDQNLNLQKFLLPCPRMYTGQSSLSKTKAVSRKEILNIK